MEPGSPSSTTDLSLRGEGLRELRGDPELEADLPVVGRGAELVLDDFRLIRLRRWGWSRMKWVCWNSQGMTPSEVDCERGGPLLKRSLTLFATQRNR